MQPIKQGEVDGSVSQTIDARAYRGKHLRLQVMARANTVGKGNAAYMRLWVTKSASNLFDNGVVFDNLTGHPVISTAWRSCEVDADVPVDATTITYGVHLVGTGRVWMDAVSLEVIDKPQSSAQTGAIPGRTVAATPCGRHVVSRTSSVGHAISSATVR